ncbi:alpha-L-arabinofuranosidase II precursor [Acetivibrio straminisolvens JCM 21531]|uniref:Alpha-L-arabinofuranosidase II n=1 Tax=Acetivibrio straminisolvens JCM 21531 TaxID=1294263 RepID=W4VDA4_9FIRM|nr:alpha-L-arabinofuranosidase II precursor [Acetivibrio straminisolvens JCM 21531]
MLKLEKISTDLDRQDATFIIISDDAPGPITDSGYIMAYFKQAPGEYGSIFAIVQMGSTGEI